MVHYHAHKGLTLDPILRQTNSVHILTPYFFPYSLNIIFPSMSRPPKQSSLQVFQLEFCVLFLFLLCILHAPSISSSLISSHPKIWRRVCFSPPSYYFPFLRSKYSPHHLVLKHPQSRVRGQVSHLHKTMDKLPTSFKKICPSLTLCVKYHNMLIPHAQSNSQGGGPHLASCLPLLFNTSAAILHIWMCNAIPNVTQMHSEDLGINGNIILKCILGKLGGKLWSGCI